MPAKMETIEKNKVKVEMTILPEQIEKGLDYSYNKNKKSFKINGFRPGKVPRKMVEQFYGVEVLFEDAINYVYPEAITSAIKEFNLEPVSDPEVSVKEATREQFVLTAEFFVKPEVTLGDYKGLEIKEISKEVTDEDVENELKRVAEMNSRLVSVEGRTAEKDDTVEIDFEGFVDGEAFEGGKGEGYSLKLGSGQFIPGFEDQLIGTKAGDDVTVKVKFPDDYHAENLKGKDAEFKVHVIEVKMTEIPEINDDFAGDVSEFETLAEYKEDIRKKLAETKERNAEAAMKAEAREKAAANATVDIPECMFDNEVNAIVDRYRMQLQNQGATLEQYLDMMGMKYEDFTAQIRPGAEKNVKEQLVIDEITKAEKIECTDEEYDAKLDEFAKIYFNGNKEELLKRTDAELAKNIRADINFEKTVRFILDNAKMVK